MSTKRGECFRDDDIDNVPSTPAVGMICPTALVKASDEAGSHEVGDNARHIRASDCARPRGDERVDLVRVWLGTLGPLGRKLVRNRGAELEATLVALGGWQQRVGDPVAQR